MIEQSLEPGGLLGGVVESTLESFESEGLAERKEPGEYRIVSPVAVLQRRQNDLWNVLRGTL
jgi:sugar-specific transcriptional regulator TrmB